MAGRSPRRWRRPTREGGLIAVELRERGDRLDVATPTELFEIQTIQGTGYDDYAVSENGSRFLIKQLVGKALEPQLHIVTDWRSLLER